MAYKIYNAKQEMLRRQRYKRVHAILMEYTSYIEELKEYSQNLDKSLQQGGEYVPDAISALYICKLKEKIAAFNTVYSSLPPVYKKAIHERFILKKNFDMIDIGYSTTQLKRISSDFVYKAGEVLGEMPVETQKLSG